MSRLKDSKAVVYFDHSPLKMRIMFSIALAFLLIFTWNTMLQTPINIKSKQQRASIEAIHNNIQILQTQYDDLKGKEAEALKHRSVNDAAVVLDDKLNAVHAKFLSREDANELLEAVLAGARGLSDLHFNVHEPTNVEGPHASAAESSNNVVMNPISLDFRSDYFTTLAYMEQLEEAQHGIVWDEVVYDVRDYPEARVSLHIHTLSLDSQGGLS